MESSRSLDLCTQNYNYLQVMIVRGSQERKKGVKYLFKVTVAQGGSCASTPVSAYPCASRLEEPRLPTSAPDLPRLGMIWRALKLLKPSAVPRIFASTLRSCDLCHSLHSSRTLLLLHLPSTDSSTNISTSFPVLENPHQSNTSKEPCFYDFEVPMGRSG
jgi:hypothetical protein